MFIKGEFSPATEKAIRDFGKEVCLEAYRLNRADGEGCTMIADQFACLGSHPIKADQAITAGSEIIDGPPTLTVKELRRMLFGMDDDAQVVIRINPCSCETSKNNYEHVIGADRSIGQNAVVIYSKAKDENWIRRALNKGVQGE